MVRDKDLRTQNTIASHTPPPTIPLQPRTPQLSSCDRLDLYLKMASRERGEKRRKTDRSWDQSDPSRNEHSSPQGGSRSSVTSTLQRDNMDSGASQTFAAGRSSNPTMSNSGNTTNRHNSRTYNAAKHNEFKDSTINGPVTNNYFSPTGISKRTKKKGIRKDIEDLGRYFYWQKMILITNATGQFEQKSIGIFSWAICLSSIRTSTDPRSHNLTVTSRIFFGSPETST